MEKYQTILMRDVKLVVSEHSSAQSLKNFLVVGPNRTRASRKKLTLLNVPQFEAFTDDKICIVGLNGQGKTTFLKVLAGIYRATEGEVITSVKPTSVLAAGIGLEDELTVEQNIDFALTMRGIDPKTKSDTSDWILEFSEMPLLRNRLYKNLSTGYKSRLSFAIAVSVTPEILVLDEVLGGGDAKFMQKASEFIAQLIKNSSTTLIATHNPYDFASICNKMIVIENGAISFYGDFDMGLTMYKKLISGDKN
jgi:ABC-2 type transport system ATP-binding protein/lipopolysaccharide transport system ATP-binding protein